MGDVSKRTVLLLSGGLDSAALAYQVRPDKTLFIDYGQRPARAEARAAQAIAREVGLNHAQISLDLSELGGGLLANDSSNDHWPSPEWWPYRNQFLLTIASAWALKLSPDDRATNVQLITGTVASDGARHADGTTGFYDRIGALLEYQEGGVTVSAPAIGLTSAELIAKSGTPDQVLGWSHSCHRADTPCGDCPGCHKRSQVLETLGRLT